jgi:5-methylcytosine-specific restriction endonuclease McrA
VNWPLPYEVARGQAGAAEDQTGVRYSVFRYQRKYGVSPAAWVTRSMRTKWGDAVRRKLGMVNPSVPGGSRSVRLITDRAKRYRAQKAAPPGKRCGLCGAVLKTSRNSMVHHLDGNESHGSPENLLRVCRSCNGRADRVLKAHGRGIRTRQYNPSRRVPPIQAYLSAVRILKGEVAGDLTSAIATVHATPALARSDYALEVWRVRRERYGPRGRP